MKYTGNRLKVKIEVSLYRDEVVLALADFIIMTNTTGNISESIADRIFRDAVTERGSNLYGLDEKNSCFGDDWTKAKKEAEVQLLNLFPVWSR